MIYLKLKLSQEKKIFFFWDINKKILDRNKKQGGN